MNTVKNKIFYKKYENIITKIKQIHIKSKKIAEQNIQKYIKQDVKSNIKQDVKSNIKQDVKSNIKQDVKLDINSCFRKKKKFAIMAIFKNEEDYMEEWLIHHIDQGVEKFYLYCNDKEETKYNFLDKYENYITLINWTEEKNKGNNTIQRQAYLNCVKKYGHEYHYIMMLDLDEFIINTIPNEKVINYLNSLKFSEIKALKIPRYDFGSNGHIKKPEGNVMDNYTKHEKIYSSFKTIANSNYINKKRLFYSVHDFCYLNRDGKIYNSFLSIKNKVDKNERGNKNDTPLVINHYITKSYEEYFNRAKNWNSGGINPYQFRKYEEDEFKKRDKNEIEGYDYI
jgi:hypothetical protein